MARIKVQKTTRTIKRGTARRPRRARRPQGETIETIAEILDISYDYARKVSQKVNRKIIKVL